MFSCIYLFIYKSVSSIAQSCPTLCNPMNHSTQGLPVHHQLPEFTQTHVHRVSDAIQPSHPLLSPFPPVPLPPSVRVFYNESTLCIRWPKYLSFSLSISPSSEHPGLISSEWTGWISLQSMGLSRVFSNTTVQKHLLSGLWSHNYPSQPKPASSHKLPHVKLTFTFMFQVMQKKKKKILGSNDLLLRSI